VAFPDEYWELWSYGRTLGEGSRQLKASYDDPDMAVAAAQASLAEGIEVWHVAYSDGVRTADLFTSVQTD
jgi:hypothetical protein